ncbi:hypothetical protein VB264_05325 [Arcicella aquatica]|uniref:Uncharacterized protein n=1 Tax=Arcicella aquatica TaxID=217141 RepID=A0ABU5QJI3_9BACT|nr:hypothetical protein [Arcicella aquatica]MEA5257198.1 hypothetical protein [Arcicella aquatica]
MKSASINIAVPYKVTVIPTTMRYTLLRDLFVTDGTNVCEISYEILAEKYIKMVPSLDAEGNPIMKYNKPVLEESIVSFGTPVLFDTGSKIIPFELYLLIESYRANKTMEGLTAINNALQGFAFEGSLTDFRLAVTNVQ